MNTIEDGFVDQFCSNSDAGIGTVYSCRYSKQKKPIQNNDFLSCSTCINNGEIKLYGIFSGFNGGDFTARFVMNQMVYELFQDNPLNPALSPSQTMQTIKKKFENVVQRYLDINSDLLNERLIKLENCSDTEKYAVSEINQKIRQGTTAIIVLKTNIDLYILNCGSSVALAISSENAIQLNNSLHNKDNFCENQRIKSLGIDPDKVMNPTRAVGDLHRTHLYEENESYKCSKGPPVVSTPDVYHFKIDSSWRHLVLLSDGVIQNLKEVEVDDIPTEVFVRLSEDHTLTSTAQALVDSFARKHFDAFITMQEDACCISNQREEMTVIYVKLMDNDSELYEQFDSAISTMESTNNTSSDTLLLPYVDAACFSFGKNFELMRKLSIH